MRLIFLVFLSTFYATLGDKAAEDFETNGHAISGAILTNEQGYAQASSQGGTISYFHSGRPRVAAVRTFNEGYVGGDRTPHLRTSNQDGNYDHDLHTAYRLPLQRLSDNQLSMILKKYSPEVRDGDTTPNMSRIEMINKVQEKIAQKRTTKLMRPTLLTSINVQPEEVTIDNEFVANPKTQERTTVASVVSTTPKTRIAATAPKIVQVQKQTVRRSHKYISEFEAEEAVVPEESHSERLTQLTSTLRKVKARYDAVKLEYLQRLREINERKINLAVAKKRPVTTTTEVPTTTTEKFHLIDNEPKTEEETSQIEVVPAETEIKKPKRVISTAIKTLIDNDPASQEETTPTTATSLIDNEPEEEVAPTTIPASTTSRTEWELSMINKLKYIVEKAKAQQKRIHNHHQEEEETTTVSEAHSSVKVVTPHPPRAHAIPRQYASVIAIEHPVIEHSGLHDGGAEDEKERTVEPSMHQGFVDNESQGSSLSPSTGGFKIAMKKVGEISTSELLTQLNEEQKGAEKEVTTTEAPTTTETPETTTRKLITVESSDVELDLFAQTDEEAICDAISCDFEKGDLCQWEASKDELSPSSPHYHRKHRKAHLIRRTWHNWQGRYRNRVTGIARAQVFSFDNQRFAAAYVRPFQRATLTGKLLSGEKETIRFRAWEATRNVQLKVCCDNTENCVFETEVGVYRGSRRWREHTATCPKGTSKIIFECINHGIYQGACGLDNIHLLNSYCPAVIPISALHDNERRRKHFN